jgi:hypothetical protein
MAERLSRALDRHVSAKICRFQDSPQFQKIESRDFSLRKNEGEVKA